jgi:hypothetical protein
VCVFVCVCVCVYVCVYVGIEKASKVKLQRVTIVVYVIVGWRERQVRGGLNKGTNTHAYSRAHTHANTHTHAREHKHANTHTHLKARVISVKK